jgi:hypothetical protein
MTTAYSKVPDLLRRFTPTPLSTCFSLGVNQVRLETNDPKIIRVFECMKSTAVNNGEPTFQWKLVRDDVGGSDKDMFILVSDDLITLFRGQSTVIVIDRGRREVLGFLSPDVTPSELRTSLVPLLVEWMQSGVTRYRLMSPIDE